MKKINLITIVMTVVVILSYSIFTSSNSNTINQNNYFWNDTTISQKSQMFVDASKEFGVPASVMIALAVYETGFGDGGGVARYNNWFGISKNSKYPTSSSCTGRFECYATVEDSVRDAARILGDPTSYYRITTIIINNGGLEGSYEDIAKSLTAHWCASECTYDANSILNFIQNHNLTKYDSELANMSVDELKAILEKYYGENAIPIPGYDGTNTGWDGKYTNPDISNNTYSSIYFNTTYTGDITKGYIYQKYSSEPLYDNLVELETDEEKVNKIISNIFIQGEKLYGDGELHISDFQFNGTINEAPIGGDEPGFVTDGTPLSCYTIISSSFGSQESFRNAKHKGMDLAAPAGTIIYSVTDGKVISVGSGCNPVGYYGNPCGGGYGNYVKIQDNNGMYFIYAHMYSTPMVSSGQTVSKGQQIGVVGSSGSSTGNHLHFEVRDKSNVKINPTPYSNYASIPKC